MPLDQPKVFPRHPALWTGALLSASVGLLFYIATSKSIESDSRERFANHARNAENTISTRIKSYTDLLRGAASLFKTGDNITRTQFHLYAEGLSLARHFPAIDTLNYAEYVRDEDRAAFEQRLRDEQASTPGVPLAPSIKPPGRRNDYSVITYIEPHTPATTAFGTDLQANPYVEQSILATRDKGDMMASGTPISAMSGPNRIYLGMRLPVYSLAKPLDTVAQRRAAYRGSVGIAFSVPRLLQGVLAEMPIKNVRMTLVDRGIPEMKNGMQAPLGERVLFDSSGLTERAPTDSDATRFSTTVPVDFNGRPWKITFSTPKSEMYTEFDEFFPKLASGAGFVGSMLIYALFHTLSSSRRRALTMAEAMTKELRDSQTKLQISHHNLRRLAAHADQIKEGERKRIAREIHDDLGQNLLALRIEVDMLASRTRNGHPRLHARARATLSQIDATIKSVRQIINDLRPNVLDLGLSAAVEWQTSEFRRRTGIVCTLIDDRKEIGISDHRATAFFRILQESLSNITRHARATEVTVELKMQGDNLWMAITDNGVGLNAGGRNKVGSFGLVGIEERISILGGTFSITSAPGKGTRVCVTAPIDDSAAAVEPACLTADLLPGSGLTPNPLALS
jgi:signal transduction histidine kinase